MGDAPPKTGDHTKWRAWSRFSSSIVDAQEGPVLGRTPFGMTGPPLPQDWCARLRGYAFRQDSVGRSGALIHRLDADGLVSLYLKQGEGEVADEIADEFARLRWSQSRLPVPRLVAFAQEQSRVWLLSQAMEGTPAFQWLSLQPERQHQAVASIGRFLRKLHQLPSSSCPFNSCVELRLQAARHNLDEGRVDESDFHPDRAGWTARQVWDELQALLPVETECAVTHGDFSLDNIFLDPAGEVLGVLDLGRLGLADPFQDLAILLDCLQGFDPRLGETLFQTYGLSRDERRLRLHLLLDELF